MYQFINKCIIHGNINICMYMIVQMNRPMTIKTFSQI